ncbi:DUF1353 domain-containing protein [Chrysiogenes arsenatis]|uniref:DUF1353 domain-containing protein n=1 Tax=Chrysiogenes arsenatis TaxID=309797 RepID=UPI0004051A85|nr:DUF1353 domain-containing protein [Chrysiogenes arsenatis]
MFYGEIEYRKINAKNHALTAPLVWRDDVGLIRVKKGFTFDGASIPRALWSLVGSPFTGDYTRAACLHDALYASELLSRHAADLLFFQAMLSDGVRYSKAAVMYCAVRVGGWFVWRKHTPKSIKEGCKYVEITTR